MFEHEIIADKFQSKKRRFLNSESKTELGELIHNTIGKKQIIVTGEKGKTVFINALLAEYCELHLNPDLLNLDEIKTLKNSELGITEIQNHLYKEHHKYFKGCLTIVVYVSEEGVFYFEKLNLKKFLLEEAEKEQVRQALRTNNKRK